MFKRSNHAHLLLWITLPALVGLPWTPPAIGQDEIAAGKPPAGQSEAQTDKPKRFPEMKDVTKDMQAMSGLFTLYRHDPTDKDRDPELLLAKIPAGMLNQDLLFATTITRGGTLTGWMWTNYLFRWEIAGNQLKMVVPNTRYITKDSKPVADVIKRTYGSRYVASLPIMSLSPGGDVLVNFSQLLKSNIARVARGGAVRPDLSTWTKIKTFPDNLLIEADLAIAQGQGGRFYGVAYAFQRLPSLGSYSTRTADQRVGYFTTVRLDWTKPTGAREVAERYINRWKLEKRDPSLELSPPKKPIMFIIEKTVPIQWRRWVRRGVEEWNKAFEQIGFVDAIVVQQQTDDNEYADYDPEDSRYNFIRWTVTGTALAVGPSRVDPRTGQILDADIVMDEGWMRYYASDFDTLGPAVLERAKGPGLELLIEKYPGLTPEQLQPSPDAAPTPFELHENMMAEHVFDQPLGGYSGCACTYAEGVRHSLALANYASIATGTGKQIPERLMGEALSELITHEVGHTLGLRHNFKGSSWLSLEEVRRRRDQTDEPLTSSVMDYNPLLFFKGDDFEKMRHIITPTIGPYDKWAIEYGYRLPENGQGEADMLKAISSRCTEPALDYATDEDTFGIFSPDPASNRYDFSNEPMEWVKTRIELCDELSATVAEWAAIEGEPRYYIRRAFDVLLSQRAMDFGYVARLVGGQYFHRDQVGDPDARAAFVLVDAATQRAALKMIVDTLFSEDFGQATPEVLNMLAPSRWGDWAGGAPFRLDYPIHDRITGYQLATLLDLIAPPVLQRIYDAELKSDAADKFTAAELITTLRDGVWRQLEQVGDGHYTDASPLIGSSARNLQRQYLNMMLTQARSQPGSWMSPDLSGMIRFALRELSDKIGRALGDVKSADGVVRPDFTTRARLDFATLAHLNECKSRIDRALDAQFTDR